MTRWLAILCVCLAAAGASAADGAVDDPARQVLVLLHMAPEHFRPDSNYAGSYGDTAGRNARRRIAAQLAREHGLTLVTAWPMPLLGADCYVMAVPPAKLPDSVAQALSHDRRVLWAQTMNVYTAQGPPGARGDPLYAVQPAARAWHLAELHTRATGRGVRVAVIDSGVEENHPDLAGQFALSANFVDGQPMRAEQHGTGVAGIIAARADNGLGIVGVAPQARLLALRACWQLPTNATHCTTLSLAMALHFALAHDAQVINLSLSGPPDRLLHSLLDAALARGIGIVAPVDAALPDGGFPASHAGVLAVAAEPSPLAPGRTLLAPGRDVPTTQPGARWQLVSGASYAAAHVAGLLALLRELRGDASPALTASIVVRHPSGGIDTCATFAQLTSGCACACADAGRATPLARQ
ncbi:S8 family peptidase [Piscinibacter sp.]|uniref:S8 family peptidase n=1 Tax=Piscinibacter sp. TaxID=1903157 RepID=UPI002F3E5D07